MAATTTSLRPPHKKFTKPVRPDDNDTPQFAPIPVSPSTITPSTARLSNSAAEPSQTTPLIPSLTLPSDLSCLTKTHAVVEMSIKSQSKIEHKVTSLISHISKFSFADLRAKPGLVVLHAKAPCANKLISVLEIAKREVTKKGDKLYQYSQLGSELTVLKEKTNGRDGDQQGGRRLGGNSDAGGGEAQGELVDVESEGEESEPAFETMRAKELPVRKKVRAVPTLTVYLAGVPVVKLEERFGEQTNI